MRIACLLFLSLLTSLSMVSTVAAQSPSDKSPESSQLAPASPRTAQDSSPSGHDLTEIPSNNFAEHILTLQQDEKTCYTIRTYRVARETPDSDTTRPAGYSTCQHATRFQLKTAVDSQEIAAR
jgi:hypothetical protein